MTHFARLTNDECSNIFENRFVLIRPLKEKFVAGEPFIFQATDSESEETLYVSGITHSVPGLMKNWIIVSLKEK